VETPSAEEENAALAKTASPMEVMMECFMECFMEFTIV
jgi:hypothetical protein